MRKHLIFTTLAIGLLSAWLILPTWVNTPPASAQDILEEDEVIALAAWGTTQDPNVAAILATQVVTQTNLTLGEVHLGNDKASGTLLEDPTISRSSLQVSAQSATELKPGSNIDPSRIRFGSGFDLMVTPGLAPEIKEQLAKPALSAASGGVEIPYLVIQFNFPVDLTAAKRHLEQSGVVLVVTADRTLIRNDDIVCGIVPHL